MIKKKVITKHARSYLETSVLRKRRRKKRIIRRLIASVFFIAIFIGAIYLLNAPFMQVRSVKIIGLENLSQDLLIQDTNTAIANLPKRIPFVPPTNILFFDNLPIENALIQKYPTLLEVKADTQLSGTVRLFIIERRSGAIWCQNPEEYTNCYSVDQTGMLYKDISSAEIKTDDLLMTGLLPQSASSSESLLKEHILKPKYLQIFTDFKKKITELNLETSYFSCISEYECAIHLKKGGKIIFNPIDDLVLAIDRLRNAISSKELKEKDFEYIDIRYGNKLFFKLLDASDVDDAIATTTAD